MGTITDQKYIQMTQTPVEKLIIKLAIPAIISMLVTAVYNAADTYFIGQINTSASAAIGVAFSVMAIIQALGFFFGQGAGSGISRALGNQSSEEAEELASVGFFLSLICGAVVGAAGLIVITPLVYFLGATDTIFPYAVDYLRPILIGAPWMTASFVLNNILRYQGNAFYSMIGLTCGGVLNIILDPIFIFVFEMGITGAALATVISQAVGFMILLWQCNHNGVAKIRFSKFHVTGAHLASIVRGGLPSLLRQGIASVASICLNVAAKPYGDAAIAAMSIVSKIGMFTNSAMIGFGQGFQPVCGYNYGAKLFDRVRKGFFFCVKVSAVFLITLAVCEFFFAEDLVGIFRRGDPEVMAIGGKALRLQCLTLPFFSVITMSNMMMQTSGKVVSASLIGIARQGVFLIPAVYIFPSLFGLLGIQMAQPIADAATMLMTIPLLLSFLREMKAQSKLVQAV